MRWQEKFLHGRPKATNARVRLHWLSEAFIADFKLYLERFCPEALSRFADGVPPPFVDFSPHVADPASLATIVSIQTFRWPQLPPLFWLGQMRDPGVPLQDWYDEERPIVEDPAVSLAQDPLEDRFFDGGPIPDTAYWPNPFGPAIPLKNTSQVVRNIRAQVGSALFAKVRVVIPVYPWSQVNDLRRAAKRALKTRDFIEAGLETEGNSSALRDAIDLDTPHRVPPQLPSGMVDAITTAELWRQVQRDGGTWSDVAILLHGKATAGRYKLRNLAVRRPWIAEFLLEAKQYAQVGSHDEDEMASVAATKEVEKGQRRAKLVEAELARLQKQNERVNKLVSELGPMDDEDDADDEPSQASV
jgi:hypothetical protein